MPDILLVSMPFGPVHLPSLGLSLLASGLEARGLATNIRYFNLDYAKAIGPALYQGLSAENPYPADLVGEWIFSSALERSGDPETYLAQVIRGGHPAHRKRFAGVLAQSHLHHEAAICLRPGASAFVDACVEEILAASPKVVGFSTVFEQTAASLAAAQRIKARSPGTLVVMGGANCEGPMGRALFDQNPCLDAVFSGECDFSFPEAMAGFFRDGQIRVESGVHVRPWLAGGPANPASERPMDDLPVPAFASYFRDLDLLDLDIPGGSAVLFETSRGCWWGEKHHCTFCGLNGEGLGYRSKSPDRALSEFRALKAAHPSSPVVVADNILDMGYFKTFLPALAEEGNTTPLFYEVKANLSKDHLRALKRAGVATVQPGIESLADGVLKLMDKGVRGLQNLQFLKWCQELGLNAVWNLLHGFPTEDPEDYGRMVARIPLLHHLTPPMACCPVRLDRFSPNFEQAEARGFSEVRPYPSYGWVFGVDEAQASQMAYYFTFQHADGRDPAVYTDPLEGAVNAWRTGHSRESLTQMDKGAFLLISDQRAIAPESLVILEGLEAEVLRACEGVASRARLESELSSAPGEVAAAIHSLQERKLLLVENDLCLALPVKLLSAVGAEVA